VDLGYAADRVFVNNASFGTYGFVVTDPAYRGAKSRTTLRTLPGLLTGEGAPTLRARADGVSVDGLRALLVSNNPYGRVVDAARPGRRERLDSGLLGVVCVRVGNTAQAARLVRGARSGGLVRVNAGEVVVEGDTATLPVGIDGEHGELPSPVVCRSAPGALRVRVPRRRPGRRPTGHGWHGWRGAVRISERRPRSLRSAPGRVRDPACLGQVGGELVACLVGVRDPGGLAGAAAPGFAERAVVDGVE